MTSTSTSTSTSSERPAAGPSGSERSLAGSTVVVTGASRGIGRAIAIACPGQVAHVALLARDAARLAEVAAETGGKAFVVDVSDSNAVNAIANEVREVMPPVRTLINNAGAVVRSPTAALTDEDWRRVMAVNVDGTFFVTRAFLADLIRERGRIINIASRAGREGTPFLSAYCAAKHGVVGFTRSLAEELRAAKVAVNAICPGSVDTAMLREGIPDARPDMTPDDIARTAVFLACTAPDALTGSCIDIFG